MAPSTRRMQLRDPADALVVRLEFSAEQEGIVVGGLLQFDALAGETGQLLDDAAQVMHAGGLRFATMPGATATPDR